MRFRAVLGGTGIHRQRITTTIAEVLLGDDSVGIHDAGIGLGSGTANTCTCERKYQHGFVEALEVHDQLLSGC